MYKQTVLIPILFSIVISSAANTIYVSTKHVGSQDGTYKFPFLTIEQASEIAMPGDTIFVLEGVYRERVIPLRGGVEGKPIVYMGEPGKKVVIKGSEVWKPMWDKAADGIYAAQAYDSLFNDVITDYPDNHNPFKVNLASTPYQRQGKREFERGFGGDTTLVYTCGQIFVNDKQFTEVPFQNELVPETWFYESKTETIFIHFGNLKPEKQEVEITTRRRIFAPQKRGLGYIVVEGFVMEHCGNQYPTNFWVNDIWAQKGAVGINVGHHWIIRRNIIRYAKTFAIDAGHVDLNGEKYAAHDNIIEENYIIENGSAGILSNSSENMIIRNNVLLRNNTMLFWGLKRWEQAAIKCHHAKNGYIHNNYIADNYLTYGIWMDNHFPDSRISRNVIVNNGKSGIFLEMSDYGFDRLFVDNNVVIGNVQNPVYCHDVSGATLMHNLFANTERQSKFGQGFFLQQVDPRTKTYHHSLYNNIFIGSLPVLDIDYPSHRGGKQRIDYNVYDVSKKQKAFCVNKSSDDPSPWTNKEFYELIKSELGDKFPDLEEFNDSKRVALTLEQWQYFWAKHDCNNDKNSTVKDGSIVTYNPETHQVILNIKFVPSSCGSQNHEFVDIDFFNIRIPQNNKAIPGPFQQLIKGENKIIVWDGLKILKKGELPDFKIF